MRYRLWAGLLAALVACGSGEDEKGEGRRKKAAPVTVVQVHVVERGAVGDVLLASATVEAEASADLSPAATGMVREVLVDVGDPVRKGALLAVIDNANLDAGEAVARSEADQLAARLAEAERLYGAGAVSAREVEDLRHQATTARIRATEASRSAGETRLTAPFDGVVAARDVRVGELASSARRAFQIVDLSTLRVRARLPERDLGRVRVGQPARLVSAYDAGRTAQARVERVAPVVDAATGTFEVLLTVDPGQDALRPGQYVSVELEVDRHADVVVVPRDAIVWDHGAPTLYRVEPAPPEPVEADAEGKKSGEPDEDEEKDEPPAPTGPVLVARRVEVRVGLQSQGTAEITEGVEPGDRIVVVGQTALKDGAKVREPAAAPEATGAAPSTPAADGG